MLLAWVVCAAGFATGALGCVLMASDARTARVEARPTRVRYSAGEWRELVEAAATDTLGLLRRLASGITPAEVSYLHVALRNAGERLEALHESMPSRIDDGKELATMLSIAAEGANAEAARLGGASVMGTDRRSFVAALRMLRDTPAAPARAGVAATVRRVSQPATADVTPSFTT